MNYIFTNKFYLTLNEYTARLRFHDVDDKGEHEAQVGVVMHIADLKALHELLSKMLANNAVKEARQ